MKFKLALILIWIGFLLAISFFEAPIKFTADGITTKIGVSIGRVVFFFLNKIELIICVLILICSFYSKESLNIYLFSSLAIIVLFQTFIALPILDYQAEQLIQFNNKVKSPWHLIYVSLEVIKLILLILYAKVIFNFFELKVSDVEI